MGSSFIDFKGYGFWARDASVEVWLDLLVQEIDKLEKVSDWLKEARSDWFEQATVGFVGCVDPKLDHFLISQERIDLVLTLSENTLRWLERQGKYLSKESLNSSMGSEVDNPKGWWEQDVETQSFIKVGRKFIELLRGDLKTNASTSSIF
ncbi:hypothetical protein [Leptolyngbya sp. FACHB-261]|uniref:hypothetical protein n=1 Tax=Leptolyngbya sp. FACHB-261 TaxID=2692806 RepID=UPI001682C19D|nr:hypothetical protein [Leptolyngbya sp. FACHB-261]MBD2101662.1 hypothetical protein [Leptolyngbya sp. FACHB-261]